MQRLSRLFMFSIVCIYLAFCGCDPAQSKNVPASLDQDSFYSVIKYATKNYLDPRNINTSRSYVGASETALKSLPHPLYLMTEDYFKKRTTLKAKDEITPGKARRAKGWRGFLVFEPDYVALDKKNKRVKKKLKNQKKLTSAERTKKFEEARKRIQKEQEFIEKSWARIKFTKSDFEAVVKWIAANKETYSKIPSTFKGENPYKKDPFGMNHVYFAAANGFLNSMDPHSGVLDLHTWNKIRKESQDSSFTGIGAMLRGGGQINVVVETPLPGSPSLRAGLRAGDIIKKVDGKSIEALPLSQVVKRIRGKKDTVVELFVERPIEVRSLAIKIKRDKIELKAVSSRYLPDEKIGVIKISSFLYDTEPPTYLVRREYKKLLRQSKRKLKGLVIDLRNNPGGDLEEAINTTGLFLPESRIVVRIKGKGNEEKKRNPNEPMLPIKNGVSKIPMVVLINAGSASASEILASALMDHNMALVVGDTSFGKASVQGLRVRGDVIVKLTTARYYAPKGYTIQVHGVVPDIRISDEADSTFPPRYRERDMWKHLPELETKDEDKRRTVWVEKLKKSVGKNDKAEKYLKKHKNDAIKPDYMLRRAITYFHFIKKFPRP